MRIGIGNAETNHDFIDKRRVGQIELAGTEICASLENQVVNTGLKFVSLEDRIIEATIGIGLILFQQSTVFTDSIKRDIDIGCRATLRCIEYMCR